MTLAGRLPSPLWLPLLAVSLGLCLTAVRPHLQLEGFLAGSTPVPTREQVAVAVKGYLDHWSPLTDPLITLENGVEVKYSSVNGIDIAGEHYFYRLRHGLSVDPITSGQPGNYQLFLVLDPATDFETEVYRLIR